MKSFGAFLIESEEYKNAVERIKNLPEKKKNELISYLSRHKSDVTTDDKRRPSHWRRDKDLRIKTILKSLEDGKLSEKQIDAILSRYDNDEDIPYREKPESSKFIWGREEQRRRREEIEEEEREKREKEEEWERGRERRRKGEKKEEEREKIINKIRAENPFSKKHWNVKAQNKLLDNSLDSGLVFDLISRVNPFSKKYENGLLQWKIEMYDPQFAKLLATQAGVYGKRKKSDRRGIFRKNTSIRDFVFNRRKNVRRKSERN